MQVILKDEDEESSSREANSVGIIVYVSVIRRVCRQTLARVRVSWTKIVSIIISLQWKRDRR